MIKYIDFSFLIGKTVTKIEKVYFLDQFKDDLTELIFTTDDNKKYKMYHEQDCCEMVCLQDIVGELDDLLNTPILSAYETTKTNEEDFKNNKAEDSETWTFYNISTVKGSVTLKWLGYSNGYYSEAVTFIEIE